MVKVCVRLTRPATESVDVVVDVTNPTDADMAAVVAAGVYGENLTGWSLDEGNSHEVYIPSPGGGQVIDAT